MPKTTSLPEPLCVPDPILYDLWRALRAAEPMFNELAKVQGAGNVEQLYWGLQGQAMDLRCGNPLCEHKLKDHAPERCTDKRCPCKGFRPEIVDELPF